MNMDNMEMLEISENGKNKIFLIDYTSQIELMIPYENIGDNSPYKEIKKIKAKSKIIQMMSHILEDLKEEGEWTW